MITDILLSGLFWHHGLFRYGPIEFSKIGIIFIILIVHRLISLLVDLFVMKTGMSNKIYVGTSVAKLIIFVLLIVFLQINIVSYDKVENGKNKYYGNLLQRIAIFAELVTIGLEIVLALVTIAKGVYQKKDFDESKVSKIGSKDKRVSDIEL